MIYTTNMIESLNARFRQATRRRGHFPNEQAALKVLYLVIRDKKKNGGNITRADQRLEDSPELVRHRLRRPDQPPVEDATQDVTHEKNDRPR